MKWSIYTFLFVLTLFGCQRVDDQTTDQNDCEEPKLGTVSLEITGNEASKALFEEGLLLLHNFAYAEAILKFESAQVADSTCAMAYWGEALAQNKPIWRKQNQDEANFIFTKLAPTHQEQLTFFQTPLEKDFCRAAHILFEFGPDKNDRNKAYMQFMEKLHKKYPDQHEVAAQYALSLLGSHEKRDKEAYMKSAKIAQSIINENPNHPGALHYLIHSYDDPVNAPKALFAANSYSKVAADASHALHMPSHIFVAMGMWDEVINSNIASFNASKQQKEKEEWDNNTLGYHAFKWLNYGYLQKGNYTKSLELVKEIQQYTNEMPDDRSLLHLIYVRGAYALESNDWNEALFNDTLDYDELPIQSFAAHSLVRGNLALKQNDDSKYKAIRSKLIDHIKVAKKKVAVGAPEMCSGNSGSNPTQSHIDRATTILLNLEATAAVKKEDFETANKKYLEAIAIEDYATYMYGPPAVIIPSREWYGKFLVKQGKFAEAKLQFEKVLERAPKRFIPTTQLQQLKKTL